MSRKAHRACVVLDVAALAGLCSCTVFPNYYSLYSEVRQEFSFPVCFLTSLFALLKTTGQVGAQAVLTLWEQAHLEGWEEQSSSCSV